MGAFDCIEMSAATRLAEGLPLPDTLTLGEIAIFWATKADKSQQSFEIIDAKNRRIKIMLPAFKTGHLKGEEEIFPGGQMPFEDYNKIRIKREVFGHIKIEKIDFLAWLESENEPKPTGCLLEKWWIDEQSNATTQTDSKSNLTTIEMTPDVFEKINTAAIYIDATIGKTHEAEKELKNLKEYSTGYKPHKEWMFSLWVYLGEPNPRDFHKKMEKYKGVKNSKIIEWWPAPGPHDNAVQVDNHQKPFSFHAIEKWINSSNNGTKAFKDKIDEIRNP